MARLYINSASNSGGCEFSAIGLGFVTVIGVCVGIGVGSITLAIVEEGEFGEVWPLFEDAVCISAFEIAV